MQLTEMEAQADGRHHGAAGWTDGSPERGQTERAEWQASWQCDGAPEGSHARRGYAEAKRADVLEALLISRNHPVAGHLALHPGHPAQRLQRPVVWPEGAPTAAPDAPMPDVVSSRFHAFCVKAFRRKALRCCWTSDGRPATSRRLCVRERVVAFCESISQRCFYRGHYCVWSGCLGSGCLLEARACSRPSKRCPYGRSRFPKKRQISGVSRILPDPRAASHWDLRKAIGWYRSGCDRRWPSEHSNFWWEDRDSADRHRSAVAVPIGASSCSITGFPACWPGSGGVIDNARPRCRFLKNSRA